MEVKIRNESISRIQVDAIINPANSFGYMGGGVAAYLKKLGGDDIEDEAIEQAPFEIGTAVSTDAGELRCDHIIHAPTMREPNGGSDPRSVTAALQAALDLAEEMELERIATPGLGTGVGGVEPATAAKRMFAVLNEFTPTHVEEIYLIDTDEDMVDAWHDHNG